MLPRPLKLTKPGLFITATDTGVGKTVTTCAIAASLKKQGVSRVAVCKPFSSGCRREREGLVSEDAEALAHFADCRATLDVINPIRFAKPLAPAVAADLAGETPDLVEMIRCMERLDRDHDVMLVEGVGGLLVPLMPRQPRITVLDLIQAVGYPVLVVARAGLGTLNHTAMTLQLLEDAGCTVQGVVISGYIPDPGDPMVTNLKSMTANAGNNKKALTQPPAESLRVDAADESMMTNRQWITRMSRTQVLATLPLCPADEVAPQRGILPEAILEAAALTYWPDVLGRQK